jgi:uncharacterized membrane protein YdfJ with MMPL/SSD domain
MGRWSAGHRKVAILGWLAFVLVSFVLGGVVGTKQLGDADAQPGEAGRAARIFAKAGFDLGDPESVLVKSKTLTTSDPAFSRTVHELEQALGKLPGIDELRSPYRYPRQVSKDGHSALIQFRLGARDGPTAGIEQVLAAVERVAHEHPELTIGEYGDASANKAIDDTTGRDFHRAEVLSIPLTLAILLFGFGAVVDRVLRRPVVWLALAGGLLVVLAVPAFSLHTNNAELTALPQGHEVTKTYERLQRAFPGDPQPAYVIVKAADVRSEELRRAVTELRRRALASGEMHDPISLRVNGGRTVAALAIPLAGSGTDGRSEHALTLLRELLVPQTVGRVPGVEVAVGGLTAESKDFADLLKARAPLVFAFVLGLAFLLLLATFRSIVVAAKAVVLNLLSVGAAYGLLVAVFQWGWGESVLGFQSTGGITSWLPLFLFVILFGLSMDYHVFILTRIREAVDRGLRTDEAVAQVIRATSGVVTNAALVMVGVFSIFGTLSRIDLKQLGVGLAAAILIDATIVRAVLLPASMALLGRWNWYLPRWLEWLPRVHQAPPAVAGAES